MYLTYINCAIPFNLCFKNVVSRVIEIIRVDVRVQKGSASAKLILRFHVVFGSSNVLLNVAKHVLHVVVLWIARVRVVIRAGSVPVRGCRELHVHYRRMLIREIFGLLAVVLRGAVPSLIEHQVSI